MLQYRCIFKTTTIEENEHEETYFSAAGSDHAGREVVIEEEPQKLGCIQKSSAVVTLHDPALALNFCDKLLLMSNGGVLGIIEPKTDTLDKTEQMLSRVYGPISLQRCLNRKGEAQIVMLREGSV